MGCKPVIATEVFDPGISIFFTSDVQDPPVNKENPQLVKHWKWGFHFKFMLLRFKGIVQRF